MKKRLIALVLLLVVLVLRAAEIQSVTVAANAGQKMTGYHANGEIAWQAAPIVCPYRVAVNFVAASNTVWRVWVTPYGQPGCNPGYCWDRLDYPVSKPIAATGQPQTFETGSVYLAAGFYLKQE